MQDLLIKLDKLKILFNERFPRKTWSWEDKEQLKINLTYYSNNIEGNVISYGDTVSYLKHGIQAGQPVKDLTELKNHKKILDRIFELYDLKELKEEDIKSLHYELMEDPVLWPEGIDSVQGAGMYREDRRYGIREGGVNAYKEYLIPVEVAGAMKKLLEDFNRKLNGEIHPVQLAAEFHYQFLNVIHPFYDGNGRVARVIANLHLINKGYIPLVIKNKLHYINSLIESEKNSSADPLTKLFANILIEDMEIKLKS